MDAVWTITDVTRYIREMFDVDYELQDIWVIGEISNYTQARSGHHYFTLKDADAQLKCVMWRSEAAILPFTPQQGDAIRAHGHISVYPAGGVYQLYADRMEAAGRGDLHQQFEALKAKLEAAGLFDPARKKPLPPFPKKIGLVTSADAAALQDILNVLSRRYPLVEVLLAPSLVQGAEAPSQIIRALALLDGREDVDLIIVARGGGSLEDLWAFNDERVAWAIYGCRHPVISGVGHETDFTIADFVADVRAPTPPAAAELATPDISELSAWLGESERRLAAAYGGRLETARLRLESIGRALRTLSPRQRLNHLAQRLDELDARTERAMSGRMQSQRQKLSGLERALSAVNPLQTLERGFAIVRRVDSGAVVRSPSQVAADDHLGVQVHGGRFEVAVIDGRHHAAVDA